MTTKRHDRTDEAARLLGVYLNDHLTGATAGVEMLRRAAAGSADDDPAGRMLAELAEEVAEDRAALLDVMARLGLPVHGYKIALGRLGELAGRLKPNRRAVSRSPLSGVLEVETMLVGVEGKASCWRRLRSLAPADPRLDAAGLDELLARAARQSERLERLLDERADRVFTAA